MVDASPTSGLVVSTSGTARPDIMWNASAGDADGRLYVLLSGPSTDFAAYDYSIAGDSYSLAIGPVNLPDMDAGSARAAIYQTPNGFLWASVMDGAGLRIAQSTNDGSTWSSATTLIVPMASGETQLTHFSDRGSSYVAVTAAENGDDLPDLGRYSKFLFYYIAEYDHWDHVTMAQGTLSMTITPINGETVTVDGKTYTFQTVLTDVDGNVAIGGSLAQAKLNLVAAISAQAGGAGAGTQYAASMTPHPSVLIADFSGDDAVLTARESGTGGNLIATTETLSNGVFDAATLGTTTDGASYWISDDVPLTSVSGGVASDGELGVVRDSSDNIYLVGETRRDPGVEGDKTLDPQIALFKRTAAGTWSQHIVEFDHVSSTGDRKRPVVSIVDTDIYVVAISQPKSESSYSSATLAALSFGSWTRLFEVGSGDTLETWRNNVVPRGAVTTGQGLPVLLDNLTDDTIWQAVIPQNSTNQPPGVYAGADVAVGIAAPTNLSGEVDDDGHGAPVTSLWTKVSGPGTVTFGDDTAPTTTATFSEVGVYVLRLTATENPPDPLSNSDEVSFIVSDNAPPGLSVISPADGADFCECDTIEFEGTSIDSESGDLSASITWESNLDGEIGVGGMFSTKDLTVGVHMITAEVTDGENVVDEVFTITIFVSDNAPPGLSVISPADGADFCECDTIEFEGTSIDSESGDLSASITWESNLDGEIGVGGMFSTKDLTVGVHMITAEVTDGENVVDEVFTITIDLEGPYPDTFVDDNGSIFETDIEWMFSEGITNGCPGVGPLYCPGDSLTWAQMASFLVRAFELPAVEGNRFDDVGSGSVHAANINALAEAGITLGCNPGGTLFCPNQTVSRAQMGSILARALGLDPIEGDVFDDVGGVHGGNINAIADLGVTKGCDPDGTLFCPDNPVTRGQMAAFLHRALC